MTNAALNILHLPDPADLVRQRLGERGETFLAEGRTMSFDEAVLLAAGIASSGRARVAAERSAG